MRNQTTNVSYEDIKYVLEGKGFILTHRKGSHVTFKNMEEKVRITIPNHKPINACYVKEVLKLLSSMEEKHEKENG